MEEAKTVTPYELRVRADRLEEEIRGELMAEADRELSAIAKRSRRNPDLAVRLAGIGEAAKLAEEFPDSRLSILTWIRLETTEWIPEEILDAEAVRS